MSNFHFDVPNTSYASRFALVKPGFNTQQTPTNSVTRPRPVTGRHTRTLTVDSSNQNSLRNIKSSTLASQSRVASRVQSAKASARKRTRYFETGIKAHLRSANSRNKDNFEFM